MGDSCLVVVQYKASENATSGRQRERRTTLRYVSSPHRQLYLQHLPSVANERHSMSRFRRGFDKLNEKRRAPLGG